MRQVGEVKEEIGTVAIAGQAGSFSGRSMVVQLDLRSRRSRDVVVAL